MKKQYKIFACGGYDEQIIVDNLFDVWKSIKSDTGIIMVVGDKEIFLGTVSKDFLNLLMKEYLGNGIHYRSQKYIEYQMPDLAIKTRR